jgi:membrane-bound serine protease (ClpP class)
VFGSIILLDTDIHGFGISRSLIGGTATAGGLSMLALIYMAMRARNRPVVSGVEHMIGATAEAIENFDGRGNVFVAGERWQAESTQPITKGQLVRVTAVHGLVVNIETDA